MKKNETLAIIKELRDALLKDTELFVMLCEKYCLAGDVMAGLVEKK